MRHYIPLRKDFSNVDKAIERFKDPALRHDLTENAHRDLIASGEFGYQRLVDAFDQVLADAGLEPQASRREAAAVRSTLKPALRDRVGGWIEYRSANLNRDHPKVWRAIWIASRPLVAPVRWLMGARAR